MSIEKYERTYPPGKTGVVMDHGRIKRAMEEVGEERGGVLLKIIYFIILFNETLKLQ